ncbi:MAG: FAD-binding oxidoreductase [Rhodospirillaceae bacterium]|nr:FAD-binding oxidoreductase [Rhodospirillaceae bacterium]
MTLSRDPAPALAALAAVVGPEHVLTDEATRRAFGCDVFFDDVPPLAVVRPGSTDELAAAVRAAVAHGVAVAPRGGGLSYSRGYLTGRAGSVCIDTARLNRIVAINTEDMYVHVEAGVTWERLNDALRPHGLRTPFWGTGSGKFATVGGTLSQNAANLGTGKYGMAADSVLGLRVALADGRVLATGSWAAQDHATPFTRWYGPDLTGLFLADCGAFGVKAEAALQLIARPPATDYCAFSFETAEQFLAALSAAGRAGLHSECFGFDPAYMAFRTTYASVGEDVARLKDIAVSQGSLLKGVKEAVAVASAGRRYLKDAGYTLHFAVDGRDPSDADAAVRELSKLCRARGGAEIPASIPKVIRATPFPEPTTLLGPRGERWIPVHGIVPHSRARGALDAIAKTMAARGGEIERHGIAWCWVALPVGRSAVLIEPTIYWRDRRTVMQDMVLSADYAARNDAHAPDPAARALVAELRQSVAEAFRELGAAHFQIGRTFPFMASRAPEAAATLRALKAWLDPSGLMNPGSLGLP